MEKLVDGLGADVSLSSVETIFDLLGDYWGKFHVVQQAIEEKVTYENMEDEIEVMVTTEASYLCTRSKLTSIAVSMNVKQDLKDEFGAIVRLHLKLPKPKVRRVDGSFNIWSSFRDMFLSMVGNKDI